MTLSPPGVASTVGVKPFPRFEPFPGLSGGHAQTIVGRYLPGPRIEIPEVRVIVEVPEGGGDRLALVDSQPPHWRVGDPAAVLIHGMAGCANSPYVSRVAAKLVQAGVRTVRVNLRGAGSGFGLAKGFYHAGRTSDPRLAMSWLAEQAPNSPIALVGFSLGANLALKLAAEAADCPVPMLDCVLAANPPLDLEACCRYLQRPGGRIYDRNFVALLHAEVRKLEAAFPELGRTELRKAQTLFDFDDVYTAPKNGFRDALHYYATSSAGPLLERIEVPGLVVHAEDDPFIPVKPFRSARFPSQLALELMPKGGHLGYFSRTRLGDDRRWLDARFTSWLLERWGLNRGGRLVV